MIEVGASLAYYAEANSPGEPYSGPYPAKVSKVHETEEGETGTRVDLVVMFSEAREHTKTRVLVSDEPAKHCASAPPEGYTFDNWFAKAAEPAPAG